MFKLSEIGTLADSAFQQTFRMPGSRHDSLAEDKKLSNGTLQRLCCVTKGQPAVSPTCDDGVRGGERDGP